MTDLPRLHDSTEDELELALIRALRADVPRAAGLKRAALALGVTASAAEALAGALPTTSLGATASASAATAPVAAGGAGGAASTTATAVTTTSLAAVGKGLLGSAVITVLGLTAVDRVVAPPASAPAAVVGVATARPAAVRAPLGASPPLPLGAPSTLPPPATEPPVRRRAAAPEPLESRAVLAPTAPSHAAFAAVTPAAPPTHAVVASPSLAVEIRMLDQARAALARSDTVEAARALDAYSANGPSPTLSQEAALLRVRLLLAQGRRSAAAELARQILAQHPRGAHVESLRALASER